MTAVQWKAFCTFRDNFFCQCNGWKNQAKDLNLAPCVAATAAADGVPSYPIENLVVYPKLLDSYTLDSQIKLIIIGDNPGKNEQLNKNCNYLVGQAGKLGDGFFKNHPELGIDFRKNVLILNKTPIHSAKTNELSTISRTSPIIADFIRETVNWMALHTTVLQSALGCPLWLIGYGALKPGKIFADYSKILMSRLPDETEKATVHRITKTLVFQHFSMNRFSIDLHNRYDESISLAENLQKIGTLHRKEIM